MRQLARLASAPRGLGHCQKAAAGKRLAAQSWAGTGLLASDNLSNQPAGPCRYQHSIPQSALPSHAQVRPYEICGTFAFVSSDRL